MIHRSELVPSGALDHLLATSYYLVVSTYVT